MKENRSEERFVKVVIAREGRRFACRWRYFYGKEERMMEKKGGEEGDG
jgi:hypothetical protein